MNPKAIKNKTIPRLAFLLVLLVVLDYASRIISFFKMPNGSILSFVPTIFIIAAIIAKPFEGFVFGIIASVFTFFLGSRLFVNLGQYLFDYPIAIGGAIWAGSIAYRVFLKWNIPYTLKIVFLSIKVTAVQFVCYTIAFYFYLPTSGLEVTGLGSWPTFIVILKYNFIYMWPIIIGNTILATLVATRFKKIL